LEPYITTIFLRRGYSPVQYLMLMLYRSEIALMAKKKKSKELYTYSVMSSVNDIYIPFTYKVNLFIYLFILRNNLGQRSPHPDYFLAIKITLINMHIYVTRQNLVQL